MTVPGDPAPGPTGERADDDRYRVLLVCSSGGHLAQLMRLRPWWESLDRSWACFPLADARSLLEGERVDWVHHPTTRNLPNLVRNLVLAVRVLRRERPDVIVSTGAGAAVPFFWVIPLALYLLTFVLVFARRPLLRHSWMLRAQIVVIAAVAGFYIIPNLYIVVGLHVLGMFEIGRAHV